MVNELDTLKAGQLKAGKASTKECEKKAKEIGTAFGADANNAAESYFVAVVNAGDGFDDAKAVSAAMETAAKACPSKALFFLSNAGGKMALLAVVPKELQGKLS